MKREFADEWNCLSTQGKTKNACYAVSFVINEIALALVAKKSSHVSGTSMMAKMMHKLGPIIHNLHGAHDIASIVKALKKVGEKI
ncbi:MAG: hypothetical protein HYV97_17975 [Bdellovibrio sp.]|nr:hypothetical protein [Bdellovibrio sp.]